MDPLDWCVKEVNLDGLILTRCRYQILELVFCQAVLGRFAVSWKAQVHRCSFIDRAIKMPALVVYL